MSEDIILQFLLAALFSLLAVIGLVAFVWQFLNFDEDDK